MRWDYAQLEINPVFPGLGEIIITIIIIIFFLSLLLWLLLSSSSSLSKGKANKYKEMLKSLENEFEKMSFVNLSMAA